MITGLNHITLTVTKLDRSILFYQEILGMTAEVQWNTGAYLSTPGIWLCLSIGQSKPSTDYSHIAFSINQADMNSLSDRFQALTQWQENSSEGNSIYIKDPDGHKLELHIGDLKTRLESLKEKPYEGLKWLNTK